MQGICGTWYEFSYDENTEHYRFVAKNTCSKYGIYSIWTVKADISSWEYARSYPMFDLREDNDPRFTNIDKCKFLDDEMY